MKVSELFEFLENLVKEVKDNYTIIDEGYMNEICKERIEVDDKWKQIIL